MYKTRWKGYVLDTKRILIEDEGGDDKKYLLADFYFQCVKHMEDDETVSAVPKEDWIEDIMDEANRGYNQHIHSIKSLEEFLEKFYYPNYDII